MKTRYVAFGLTAAMSFSIWGCAAPMLSAPQTTSAGKAGSPNAQADQASSKAEGGAATGSVVGAGPGSQGRPASAAPSAAASTAPAAKPGAGPGAINNNGGGLIGADGSSLGGNMGAPMPPRASAPAPSGVVGKGGEETASDDAGFAPGEPLPNAEALKAGAVDDNAKFKDYMEYVRDFMGGSMPVRKLDVSERHVIRVVDADGKGVSNAIVAIKVGNNVIAEAKTYADGRTLFHPTAYAGLAQSANGDYQVSASKGESAMVQSFQGTNADEWVVKLPAAVEKPAAKLDMAIVLDTTGSMGGEIKKFQSTISTIAQRLQALPQQPSVRFGLVAYKDQRETYVSKVASEFTPEVGKFQQALNLLGPGGGGDKPEDLEAALTDTVQTLKWDEGEAVRLSFVVTDAAPHTDYPQSTPYTDSMQLASKKGIKLYAIGASSLEEEGEYALRQLAQWTMAKYLFVTRGGDEATGGGGTASATVDAFREGRLDDIVVSIVQAELDQLGK